MIDRQTAITQIRRMARLRGAPDPNSADDKPAIDEIIKALCKTAENDIHAFDIVSEILEKSQYFPTPADIYGQAREPEWHAPRIKRSYNCQLCQDTGWCHVDDGGQGTARRCSCRPVAAPPKTRAGGMSKASEIRWPGDAA